MTEKQSEYVTGEDVLGELMYEISDHGYTAGKYGSDKKLLKSFDDMREYVNSQLAEAHEVAESLRHVIDAKDAVIASQLVTVAELEAKIEALKSDLRDLRK